MSIQKRSVLYTKTDKKQYRFIGWAIATTSLGAMLEPFDINAHNNPGVNWVDFDPSDPIARVDDLQNIDIGKEALMTSFGETMEILGGERYPRVLKKTGNF